MVSCFSFLPPGYSNDRELATKKQYVKTKKLSVFSLNRFRLFHSFVSGTDKIVVTVAVQERNTPADGQVMLSRFF